MLLLLLDDSHGSGGGGDSVVSRHGVEGHGTHVVCHRGRLCQVVPHFRRRRCDCDRGCVLWNAKIERRHENGGAKIVGQSLTLDSH